MTRVALGALVLITAVSLFSIGCAQRCTLGASVGCACVNGSQGAQQCRADGTLDSCVCSTPGGGTGGTGGSSGGGAGGGSVGGGTAGGGDTGGGSAGGGGGSVPDAGLPLSDFCAQYVARACAHLAACGIYESATSVSCLETESIASDCAKVTSGSVDYDPVEALRCLEELSATPLSCYTDFAACGRLRGYGYQSFTPVFKSTPGRCLTTLCDAGTSCDEACAGPACQPLRAVGQTCSENGRPYARCNPATGWCGSTDGGATECLSRLGVGGDCSTGPCALGLHCSYSSTTMLQRCEVDVPDEGACVMDGDCTTHVCRRSDSRCGAIDAGAACASANDCGTYPATQVCRGLVVRTDGGVTAGICGPRPSLGEACDYAWVGVNDPCREDRGEGCIDGVCRQMTPYSFDAGAECPIRPYGRVQLPFFGFASCTRDLRCLPSTTAHAPKTGRCAAPVGVGGACRDSFWCTPGLLCSGRPDGGSECAVPPQRGDSCTPFSCRRDQACVDDGDGGRCQAPLPEDAGCSQFELCAPRTTCQNSTCSALPGVGASCFYDFECASNVCSAGQCVAMCLR